MWERNIGPVLATDFDSYHSALMHTPILLHDLIILDSPAFLLATLLCFLGEGIEDIDWRAIGNYKPCFTVIVQHEEGIYDDKYVTDFKVGHNWCSRIKIGMRCVCLYTHCAFQKIAGTLSSKLRKVFFFKQLKWKWEQGNI